MSTSWRTALLLSGVLILGLLPAAIASADDNKIVDNPTVTAEVTGSVQLVGPDETPNTSDDGIFINSRVKGHYIFVDTSLVAQGNHPNFGPIAAVYTVNASGDTDSIQHDGAGENTSDGGWDQSDADNDGKTTGELTAARNTGVGPNLDGSVKFHRLDSVVIAFGYLEDTNGNQGTFSAELQFTPTSGTGTANDPITEAALTGVAEIGTTSVRVPSKV